MTKHTEASIILLLDKKYKDQAQYKLANAFVFGWESDFFLQRQNQYVTEFEVKISRADFFKDKEKVKKHELLQEKFTKTPRPNKFYYVVYENMISVADVPKYAGLMYVTDKGLVTIKEAPFIHKEKMDLSKKLCTKFYFYWLQANSELQKLKQKLKHTHNE